MVFSKTGGHQGAANPGFYALAAQPANQVFHDVNVTTSGVGSACAVATPSMCNNSDPSSTPGSPGGQPGFLAADGFDEATSWGSDRRPGVLGKVWNNAVTSTLDARPDVGDGRRGRDRDDRRDDDRAGRADVRVQRGCPPMRRVSSAAAAPRRSRDHDDGAGTRRARVEPAVPIHARRSCCVWPGWRKLALAALLRRPRWRVRDTPRSGSSSPRRRSRKLRQVDAAAGGRRGHGDRCAERCAARRRPGRSPSPSRCDERRGRRRARRSA